MDSTTEARLALVGKYAIRYQLDPGLVAAVCEQESGWSQWAMRYEPAFFARYIKPMVDSGKVATPTEAIARATSWGLCQVMGQVAREFGFTGRFLSELCDWDTGLDMGCKVLKHKLDAASSVEGGLLLYNGGANKDYGSQVLARVSKYTLTPPPVVPTMITT